MVIGKTSGRCTQTLDQCQETNAKRMKEGGREEREGRESKREKGERENREQREEGGSERARYFLNSSLNPLTEVLLTSERPKRVLALAR